MKKDVKKFNRHTSNAIVNSRDIRAWRLLLSVGGACGVLVLAAVIVSAQQTKVAAAATAGSTVGTPQGDGPTPTKPAVTTTDTRYRIGPGDVLDVRVARAAELSRDTVRVDQGGMIRMPMLDEDIRAACLTEGELGENIAKLYRKYKNNPHVDVFVKEFQSQPVSVIGAVKNAAQFKLQRRVSLLELLTFAGGPSDAAGQNVQIVRAGGPSLCDSGSGDTENNAFVNYKLAEVLRGMPEANPFVQPGDIVSLPPADQVYVIGNVRQPRAVPMKEPLTVSHVIAMAGGTGPASNRDKIRIIRQLPGSTAKQEIVVDLAAIEKNKAEDVVLMPNDVVDVPTSGTKSV